MAQSPDNRRYVTRVYGRRYGTYRTAYVHRTSVPVGGAQHDATSIAVGGDSYLFVYGYAPSVGIGKSLSAGVGTVTVQGHQPAIAQGISVGVGTITISGGQIEQIGEQANRQDVRVTRILPARVSYSGGVYRKGSYHVVRRVVHLTAEQTETAGVGTITIQGYAPTISATEGELVLPGAGLVTISGFAPGRVLQDLTYTGLWKDVIHRTVVGKGVYRRPVYRKLRQFVYFQTYPVQNNIEVGLGEVTISGYQVFLEPRAIPVGLGQVDINGLPPSPLLDDSVQSIDQAVLEAIKQTKRRRYISARYEEAHRPVSFDRTVVQFVQPDPQRIIGVPNGTITLTGYQATLLKRIAPLATGDVTIDGGQVTTQVRTLAGVGTVTIQGGEPSLEGDITIQVSVGVGSVVINGNSAITNAAGVVSLAAGVGSVVINGSTPTVQDEFTVAVGVGDIVINGAAPGISTQIDVGAGTVIITGYTPTANLELSIIQVGDAAQIYIQNLQIGLSIPEIAIAVGTGALTIEGNTPTVIKTGAWVKKDRKNTAWTKESKSGDNWSKTDTTSTTWTKL